MSVVLDTFVWVAILVTAHPNHAIAFRAFKDYQETNPPLICAHSLAELFGVLTKLPLRPKISPGAARSLIERSVLEHTEAVRLEISDYTDAVRRAVETGCTGGTIYDALIIQAAVKRNAEVATFNGRDFLRLWPDNDSRLRVLTGH